MINWIIVIVAVAMIGLAIRSLVKNAKSGGCAGCSSCSCCDTDDQVCTASHKH